jgi:protein involved in polysaccharide export with SLBB domain
MRISKIWPSLAVLVPLVASAQLPLAQPQTQTTPQTAYPGSAAGSAQTAPAMTVNPATPFFSTPSAPVTAPASAVVPGAPMTGIDPASTRYAPPVPDAQVIETSLTAVPVFGQSLFQGRFALESFKGFNPDYLLSVGDQVDVRLWGAIDLQLVLLVDAQGNIFIPRVGPVRVVNVRNGELNEVVKRQVRTVYREDVGVYATLAAAVPVKVFVSGFVNRPGLYPGYASDSLLNFLDRAGGISAVAGSYIDVRVLRGGTPIAQVDLYDFLIKGSLAQVQLRDGDSVFVGPIGPDRKSVV